MCYFDGCFVGNRVWDKILGNGVIKSCDKDADDILVVFEDDKKYPTVVNFDYRGCIDCGYGIQRLQYYKSRDIVITQDDLMKVGYELNKYYLSSAAILFRESGEHSHYVVPIKDYDKAKYTRTVHREEPKFKLNPIKWEGTLKKQVAELNGEIFKLGYVYEVVSGKKPKPKPLSPELEQLITDKFAEMKEDIDERFKKLKKKAHLK